MSETIAVVSLDPTGEGNKVLQHITEEFDIEFHQRHDDGTAYFQIVDNANKQTED